MRQTLADGIASAFDAETSRWFLAAYGDEMTMAGIKASFKLRLPVTANPENLSESISPQATKPGEGHGVSSTPEN